jgi:hypothetical protein
MRTSIHDPRCSLRISSVKSDAVILGKRDWKTLKRASLHVTPAEEIAAARQRDEEKRQALEQMESRRQTILENEARRQQLNKAGATQSEMDDHVIALQVAEAKAAEELDEVKAMNSEAMAARVRTIRDAQVAQHQERLLSTRSQNAATAKMLEDGRLRAVEIYTQREAGLRQARMGGRGVLLAQIEERRANQQLETDKRAREKEQMRQANEQRLAEDQELERERKERQREFLRDCVVATDASRKRKVRDREREIEEVQAMVEYQHEQAAREAEREREVERGKKLKEMDVAEVRKQQQKAIDTQAQTDEVLARRVQEETERRARQKELDELERRRLTVMSLRKDRETALEVRQQRLIEIAKLERRDFDKILQDQQIAREKARKEYDARQAMSDQYRRDLKAQLDAREAERRIRPLRGLDEGKHLQEVSDDYVARLEAIRQAKIQQLADEGVPEKYLVDLRNKRLTVR